MAARLLDPWFSMAENKQVVRRCHRQPEKVLDLHLVHPVGLPSEQLLEKLITNKADVASSMALCGPKKPTEDNEVDVESDGTEEVADKVDEAKICCAVCSSELLQSAQYKCDTCHGAVCDVNCMGLTACQTDGGECRKCFDFTCQKNGCDNDLDRQQSYLEDADPTPYCKACQAKC